MAKSDVSSGSATRYYTKTRDIWKQLPYLSPFVLFFIVTIFYASGLTHKDARMAFYLLSLVFPLIIVLLLAFTVLSSVRRYNFYQFSQEGIETTLLGFIHRTVRWSDIGRFGKTNIGNVEGLGMEYKPSFTKTNWMIRNRRKLFGWDELVPNAYSNDGESLISGIVKELKRHTKGTKRP